MSEIIGRDIEIGVGIEETRGTPQGTAEAWAKKVKATVVEKSLKSVDPSTRKRLEDSLGARVQQKWIEGDLEKILHADFIGYLLYNLYGSVATTNPATGVYQHTFSVLQSIQHPSLTLFGKDGGVQQKVFSNCMISELVVSASVNDYVRATAKFAGKAASSNSSSPSYGTEYDFIGRDISLKFADTEGGLAGATAVKAKDVSVTWSQPLARNHVLGSYNPDDLYNTAFAIELKFTRDFLDTTFKDLFLADTYKYVQLTIQGAADIGSGNNPTLTLVLNRAQVMDWNRDGGADELVTEPITVKAFYNETDGEMSSLVLKNKTAEYDQPLSA